MLDISAISSDLANTRGNKPVAIIKLNSKYYSTVKLGANTGNTISNAKGNMLSKCTLVSSKKKNNSASITTVNVDIYDFDGELKTMLDTNTVTLYKLPCEVYYGFTSNDSTSQTLKSYSMVFKGDVTLPVSWNENDMLFSFTVESRIEDKKIGYAWDNNTLPANTPESFIGQAWPVIYGSVVRSPAMRITNLVEGNTQQPITDELFAGGAHPKIPVSNAYDFAQGTSLSLLIENRPFTGTFSNGYLQITGGEELTAEYSNVQLLDRPATDEGSKSVLYISTTSYNNGIRLQDKWCRINDHVGYCIKQEGLRCIFSAPWPELYDSTTYIDEVAKYGLLSWGIMKIGNISYENQIGSSTFTSIPHRDAFNIRQCSFMNFTGKYNIASGSKVQLANQTVKYVVNTRQSESVVEVLAERNINGGTVICTVPSDYFTVTLNGASPEGTTITFTKPLSSYEKEGWSDNIYVSSIGKSITGGTVADVIKDLLTTYTSITPDTTTFSSVSSALTNFKVNMYLKANDNVIDVCESLAEQANCALIYGVDSVKIKFLGSEPSSDFSLSDSIRMVDTLKLSTTNMDSFFTDISITWVDDLSRERENKIYEQSKVNTYGSRKIEFNNFIYNQKDCITSVFQQKYKRAYNIWKINSYSVPITCFGLEAFDTITNSSSIKCVIENVETDWLEGIINLTVWLPVKLGTTAKSTDAWPFINISSQTDPVTNRESLQTYKAEQLVDGYTKHDVVGSEKQDPEDNIYRPLGVFLGKVTSLTEDVDTVNVKLFDTDGTLAADEIVAKCSLSQVADIVDAYPTASEGVYVLVTEKAKYTDGTLKEDYWIVDIFHEATEGGGAQLYGTIKQAPVFGTYTTYKVLLDGDEDISGNYKEISKLYHNSTTVNFCNFVPWFSIGDKIKLLKITVLDVDYYYIDETLIPVGSAKSIVWDSYEGRMKAVWR